MSIFQDKKLVLHISLEIIILGSMTYFFHTKSKSLELRVKSIEEQFSKEISILQDSIIQLKKQLKKSDMAIEEIKNVQHSQNQFAPKLKNEPRQVEQRQAETMRAEQRQVESMRAEPRQAETRQAEAMRAEPRQAETRQAEAMRAEPRQAEAMRVEQRQAEAMRTESRQIEAMRVEQRQAEQRQVEQRQVEQRQVEPNKDQFEDIVFTTFSIQQVPVYKQHATVELIEIDDKEYNKLTSVSTYEEHVNDKDDKHVNDESVNDEHVNEESVNDEHVNDKHVNDENENEEKGNELDKELENELRELEN
jgi:hypothetical protein